MPEIQFTPMIDLQHEAEVLAMMRGLYSNDIAAAAVDLRRSPQVIRTVLEHPERGRIILFVENATIHGYAILIPYLSNEFGGTILFIDELFVKAESRQRGIARQFFDYLRRERPYDPVAMVLEVSPSNVRARKLYESVGFVLRDNALLVASFE
ncbi:MAG TPA: GNAT family N-acetyltransferase [Humisphaera sp.]|jgi:ribosomal protein S18 acetylase RimI-like enzyme|nr:GNAT family N-acetyltransferase [Humisphaera sp.]